MEWKRVSRGVIRILGIFLPPATPKQLGGPGPTAASEFPNWARLKYHRHSEMAPHIRRCSNYAQNVQLSCFGRAVAHLLSIIGPLEVPQKSTGSFWGQSTPGLGASVDVLGSDPRAKCGLLSDNTQLQLLPSTRPLGSSPPRSLMPQ